MVISGFQAFRQANCGGEVRASDRASTCLRSTGPNASTSSWFGQGNSNGSQSNSSRPVVLGLKTLQSPSINKEYQTPA
ncbi:hypothetical protein PoB_006290500 [Plakobranchus ocellatus]|uniref:Uncharacterized protein n=1 Tax=Plakobranchus ocellatus TaxID=259542 RepID=A0AAV4CWY0_9GAST|nr:hypothetical protein PoB_006290500 [Plakobranchus ocellatus]